MNEAIYKAHYSSKLPNDFMQSCNRRYGEGGILEITTEIISKLNPCKDRFDNFKTHYPNFNSDLVEFIKLEEISYNDKIWVITRLFSVEQNRSLAFKCAYSVLPIYENKYTEKKELRITLEAYMQDRSEENRVKLKNVASAATTAAAYAADAYAAAYAAYAAAFAVAYVTYAAYAAAAAAVDAATYAANRKIQQELNLTFAVEVSREGL
jgi:hypothetical protein